MKNKKGVSPTIATILLVALVIVIGIIVFMWFRSISKEAVVKFDKNIELVCGEVEFEASYTGGKLYISNLGDIPIYQFNIKQYKESGYETQSIDEISDWPSKGLAQWGALSPEISFDDDVTKIVLIPILAGSSESGQKTATCEEKDGFEIII